LSIPNNVDLRDQLTQREYGFSQDGQRIKLETKADMVKRGVDSPDIADALALTFAAEIATFDERIAAPLANPVQWDYDPLDMRN
jgi:hypothetical protein